MIALIRSVEPLAGIGFLALVVWFVPASIRNSRRMDDVVKFRRQMRALGTPKEIR